MQARMPQVHRLRPPVDVVLGAAGIVTFFVVWHILVEVEVLSPISVPLPLDVLGRVGELLVDDRFLDELCDTMYTWLAGVVLTSAVAIPAGLVIGYFASLYRPTATVIHAARSVPSTALVPIAILFFGLGFEMKLSLVVYAIFWPLLLNAMYGVHGVDPQAVMVARSLRWNRVRILRRVVLPSAAPAVATGIRVAGAIALIVVLSAELLGASRGIGTVIVSYQQAERPDFVYAGILVVGAIGVAIYYGLSFLERLVLPWSKGNRR